MSPKGEKVIRKRTPLRAKDLKGLSREEIARVAIDRDRRLWATNWDKLTGIATKAFFTERLEAAMAHARRGNSRVSLLVIDLDHFKSVNDRFGHFAGDSLLRKVVRRLPHYMTRRELDLWSRWGGDEFALMLIDASIDRVETIARSICTEIARPFYVLHQAKRRRVHIGASVGVAVSQGRYDTADTLFKRADAAVYVAKRRGKGQYHIIKDPV